MLKRWLALCLSPFAALVRRLQPLMRVWAWTRLRQYVPDLPSDCVILGTPEVQGTGRITCGHALYLYRELHLETQSKGRIHLGDRVVLSRGVHIVAFEQVHIGSGSMVGEYSSLRDANHKQTDQASMRDSGHEARPIHIGNNVWIGRGAVILAGVSIGDGAVVAANAVVNRDVPAGALVGGVPARVLRLPDATVAGAFSS